MSHWTWACAAQAGTSHLRTGQRLQDAYSCFHCGPDDAPVFVGIVSDGAGSAALGGEGASLVCRSIGLSVRQHFAQPASFPDPDRLKLWVGQARALIARAAAVRDRNLRDFACTLVCVVSDGTNTLVAHVGDGCAVFRDATVGEWFAPVWPDHGEYASTTTFMTDQPALKLRVVTEQRQVDVIALFSDGIERMVLDMAAKKPSAKFFEAMAQPVMRSPVSAGKDAGLSGQLKHYLGSSQVNARTDDDKTLVIAALR